MSVNEELFKRTELLIGGSSMQKIQNSKVILFGVGGVGSWCAESLVRSGIGCLTIVDFDNVSASNINRQLPATTQTVGQPKVEVLKSRLLEINPNLNIQIIRQIYSKETSELFKLETYDYIVDAIDSLENKAELICTALQTKAVLFSSMGAALKMDTTKIKVAEFWKVTGCPLGAALRRKMRQRENKPNRKFYCVYSDELLANKGVETFFETGTGVSTDGCSKKVSTNGTLVHVTAIFGFTLAGLVIKDICRQN